MILKATPERKRLRAATAVNVKPNPVYLKLSFKRLCSAWVSGSLVFLLNIPSRTTTAPATPPYRSKLTLLGFNLETRKIRALTAVMAIFRHEKGLSGRTICLSVTIVREPLRSRDPGVWEIAGVFWKIIRSPLLQFFVPLRSTDEGLNRGLNPHVGGRNIVLWVTCRKMADADVIRPHQSHIQFMKHFQIYETRDFSKVVGYIKELYDVNSDNFKKQRVAN